MFRKIWYSFLNIILGSYIRNKITEYYMESQKVERTVYMIPIKNMDKNKIRKFLNEARKELNRRKKRV